MEIKLKIFYIIGMIMKKIKQLDKNIDLYISYSWMNSDYFDNVNHGICGHTFEMIEYYWKLKDHLICKLLWCEKYPTWKEIEIAIRGKYNFNEEEIKNIKDNSIFLNSPSLLSGSNILITDGNFKRVNISSLIFKNIFGFSCGNKDNYLIDNKRVTILQDETIQSDGKTVYKKGSRTKHYIKKLLLNRYKDVSFRSSKTSLLYLTGNCRAMSLDDVRKCINEMNEKYKPLSRGWLIATDKPEEYKELEKEFKLSVQQLPIENFHEKFDNYVYTPISRKWDCSNRLLVECKYYNKTFNFWNIDEDYLKEDRALLSRKFQLLDINNLDLDKDDEIISIIQETIK